MKKRIDELAPYIHALPKCFILHSVNVGKYVQMMAAFVCADHFVYGSGRQRVCISESMQQYGACRYGRNKVPPKRATAYTSDQIFLYIDGVTGATDKNNRLYGKEDSNLSLLKIIK